MLKLHKLFTELSTGKCLASHISRMIVFLSKTNAISDAAIVVVSFYSKIKYLS